jgi:hypothetical protein
MQQSTTIQRSSGLIYRLSQPTMTWRSAMRFVRFVKKVLPEKSLKTYAWYGWI